jgi:bifunctional non-homologous end joining protein LigD
MHGARTNRTGEIIRDMVPAVLPQLVGNSGFRALATAIDDPTRYAIEPKVDGVRGLITYQPDGSIEARNRGGKLRDWFRDPVFRDGLARLAQRLPLIRRGTVLDGELTAGRFSATMAAIYGSRTHAAALRLVVFDVPFLAGVDLRDEPWEARRERLELLARAFDYPFELSPVVEPSQALAVDMQSGDLEGIVLKDRQSRYRGGSRAGWSKVKDRGWYEREAWRFERR